VALGAGCTAALPAAPVRARAALAGCPVFPADDYWHADVRRLAVDPRGPTWLSHMSPGVDLHPDFGPSYGDGPNYGIPITVVAGTHPRVPVSFTYADESDRVRYPFGSDTRIEGGRDSGADMHAVVVDRDHCRLYETWQTRVRDGHWRAGSGATWSLRSDRLRPDGWTSADAAGLPILPGLLRWAEVRDDRIDHAIRFTTDVTSRHHLWPARHDAGSTSSWAYPPMGARFRLRASYDAGGLGTYARRVVAAMKTYGLVLADNGSPWYFQGEQNAHWPAGLIADLKRIPARAFVAVDTSSLRVSSDSGAAAQH
ncbi:MAG TPA: hypothetical protein VN088_20405, partial [Nocardioides sp.]|nr:hypothetical protein [Nocardioides sp.]